VALADGAVSVVLAQDRDRLSREPAYHYLLKKEFEEHGCSLRALNDRGDASPEGELMDGVFDQFVKFERAKTAERTRRGKLRKAREGQVIRGGRAPFGFRYTEAGDKLLVHEPDIAIVEKIFRYMLGRSISRGLLLTRAHARARPSGDETGQDTCYGRNHRE
jgi:site-specific DNA recombinase